MCQESLIIREVAVSIGHRQPRAMVTRAGSVPKLSTGSNIMKAYVMTTGVVFGLLTLAHIWRGIEEGPYLATEPWFILITVAAAALCVWALRLLWRSPR